MYIEVKCVKKVQSLVRQTGQLLVCRLTCEITCACAVLGFAYMLVEYINFEMELEKMIYMKVM